MKKRGLTIVVLLIVLVIITVIVVDFLNNRPDRRGSNPYALEVEHFKDVDSKLISHKETRNLSLGSLKGSALVYARGKLFVTGSSNLVIMDTDGSGPQKYDILPGSVALLVEDEGIFVAYKNFVAHYDGEMKLIKKWESLGEQGCDHQPGRKW